MIVGRALPIIALGVCVGIELVYRATASPTSSPWHLEHDDAVSAGGTPVALARAYPTSPAAKDTIDESMSHSTGATSSVYTRPPRR